MNELQSVTDIDEVIKYAEREAEECHQTASAFHTDEGVYLHEETRFQYKAILWENIHEWLEELKERRQVTGKLNSELEYKAKVKELEDAIARCERAEKEFASRTCKFRSPINCDFCAFHSECEEHWKEGGEK